MKNPFMRLFRARDKPGATDSVSSAPTFYFGPSAAGKSVTATPIPLANGGTGASSAKAALSNLGIFYSASLPSSGTDGQICLVPV